MANDKNAHPGICHECNTALVDELTGELINKGWRRFIEVDVGQSLTELELLLLSKWGDRCGEGVQAGEPGGFGDVLDVERKCNILVSEAV